MPLTVLSNHDVSRILHSLTKDDILKLQEEMADALHWYSTSADDNEYGSDFQPERIQLKRKDGSSSVFMPASGCKGHAVKVVSAISPDSNGLPSLENLSLDSEHSSRSSLSSASRSESPRGSLSTMSSLESKSSHSSELPDVSKEGLSTGKAGDVLDQPISTVRGSLTLMDQLGNTTGLINAEEVTAFRTALCSTMLLKKRHSVHDVTIFGAGKQAYWHIRLAMLLRGHEIHHLNIVNRNFDSP